MKKSVSRLIRFYQKYLSIDQGYLGKLFGNPAVCIYDPTCSEYTYQAVNKYGVIKGFYLGIKRLLRCHPFAKGGHDPLK
ncbi:membrane protein insertion efficiency factor YidD [bacterium]|nr:membrane protein insertion efficiency factor YidD [bacterium]